MLGFPIESDGADGAAAELLPRMAIAAPAPAPPASIAMINHFLLLCGFSPGDALVIETVG